jgi:ribosome-binding protein aMBF1 (putative translation factor)
MMQCPICGRDVEKNGDVDCDGVFFSIFQCDECTVMREIFGESFEVALTFSVDEQGRAFDPVDDSLF